MPSTDHPLTMEMESSVAGQEAVLAALANLLQKFEGREERLKDRPQDRARSATAAPPSPSPFLPVARTTEPALPTLDPRPDLPWERESWEEKAAPRENRRVGRLPSWFWLTVPVITAAGIWHILPKLARSQESEQAGIPIENRPDSPGQATAAQRRPPTVEETTNLIGAYLSADSPEALRQTIRDPDSLAAAIESHHALHPLVPRTLSSLELLVQQDLGGYRYYLAKVRTSGSADESFLIVDDGERGWRVDWETQVAYNPVTWEELRETRPTSEIELRAIATPGSYYNFDFSDWRRHACIELRDPDGGFPLYAYLGRETENSLALLRLLDIKGESSVMVRIRYPENPRSQDQVLLSAVVQFGWLRVPAAPPGSASSKVD